MKTREQVILDTAQAVAAQLTGPKVVVGMNGFCTVSREFDEEEKRDVLAIVKRACGF